MCRVAQTNPATKAEDVNPQTSEGLLLYSRSEKGFEGNTELQPGALVRATGKVDEFRFSNDTRRGRSGKSTRITELAVRDVSDVTICDGVRPSLIILFCTPGVHDYKC